MESVKRLEVEAKEPLSYRPHSAKMAQFHEMCESGTKRVVLLLGGIRSGKTHGGVHALLREVLKPETQSDDLFWIVSPTYSMSEVPQRKFDQALDDVCGVTGLERPVFLRHTRAWHFSNGAVVQVKTGEDPDRLRGPALKVIQIDEGSRISGEAWRILRGRVLDTQGLILITTTPCGNNWLVQQVIARCHAGNPRYGMVVVRTDENGYLDAGEVAELAKEYGGQHAAQELRAEIVDFEGLVYPPFVTSVVREGTQQQVIGQIAKGIEAIGEVICGLDFGLTDPTCVSWIWKWREKGEQKASYLKLDEWEGRRVGLREVAEVLRKHWSSNRVTRYWGDPSAAQEIFELNALGIPVEGAENNLANGIRHVHGLVTTGRYQVGSNCGGTIRERSLYCWQQWRGSLDLKNKPLDRWNHHLDADRYALYSDHVRNEGYEPDSSWLNEGMLEYNYEPASEVTGY